MPIPIGVLAAAGGGGPTGAGYFGGNIGTSDSVDKLAFPTDTRTTLACLLYTSDAADD